MAKSKSGGTRSYLRGRIASDVYSIGRDSAGKKQQVVRSLAEQVKNPQTVAQMRGRMIMSTVMQAVSAMAPIIDHSFDNVPNGQPSISEFIRRNYALIKADVAAHPSTGNFFGLNKYKEKGARPGRYIVSTGKATLPSTIVAPLTQDFTTALSIQVADTTAGAIRARLGLAEGDYVTTCGIKANGTFVFYRFEISYALPDNTVISAENIAQLVIVDDPLNLGAVPSFEAGDISVKASTQEPISVGCIFSKKVDGSFEHSECVLSSAASQTSTADVALPTYPEGTERFLNGGEL